MSKILGSTALLRFIILASALAAGGCGVQPDRKPAAPDELTIREVWPVPGYTKDQLFDAANNWLRTNFSNEVDIIQYANRSQGIVVGKSFIPYQRPNNVGISEKYDLRFTLAVEVKDGKVRTTFSDLYLFSLNEIGTIYDTDIQIIRGRLKRQVQNWIASLTSVKKDENW